MFGKLLCFKCFYPCFQGLVQLEKELGYLGGMCASSLMRKEITLPAASSDDGDDEVEPIAEAAQQVSTECY